MRGQFHRGDGLVLHNNISKAGAKMILAAAFRNTVPTFYVGLVKGLPTLTMTMATLVEPTIGTNGYSRVNIPRTNVGWPTENETGSERYIESDWAVFTAAGGDFDQTIQRIMLINTNTYNAADDVYALSEPLPAEVTITPTTPLAERRFKYRIYL